MKHLPVPILLFASICAACVQHPATPPKPASEPPLLSWSELAARPLPPAGERIAYGPETSQFGELRMPVDAKGPVPVVVLIHGGCWLADFDYAYMRHLAAALSAEGYATWTIEYRRLGEDGGGWPNTFNDVGAAIDQLRGLATTRALDLGRVITIGHSAGGQLALWAASRPRLGLGSPLHADGTVPIRGVIGLAAITDLADYRNGPADSCHGSVEPLMGGSPDAVPKRYSQVSPIELLPLQAEQWLIQGERDPIVDSASVERYVKAAKAAGDEARLIRIGSGHFDPVAPEGPSWQAIRQALRRMAPVR